MLLFYFVVMFFITTVGSVKISEEEKKYIINILERSGNAESSTPGTVIVPPLPCSWPGRLPAYQDYIQPSVMIWDPLSQYPGRHRLSKCCPSHKGDKQILSLGRWLDGSLNSLCPRILLDTGGPVLLIARQYYCSFGQHYTRSTDPELLAEVSEEVDVPFVLTHRYGCTATFLREFVTSISNGIPFHRFQSMYLERVMDTHYGRINRFWVDFGNHIRENGGESLESITDLKAFEGDAENAFRNHCDKLLELCPSDDFLCDLFLKYFQMNKNLYEQSMATLSANALMADHTFKVTLNIGISRKTDNAWCKQYNSLFIVLNEKKEVVSWQFAKKEQFDIVKELLTNLHRRIHSQGATVHHFIVDNCCKWKGKLKEVFGCELQVKLDLFHAVQRLTSTMNKRHPLFTASVKELKQVFREREDIGTDRLLPTPNRIKLRENLESYVKKWRRMSNVESGIENNLFRAEFDDHVANLLGHIDCGCLSDIPPGYSTSTNESLHEKLNDLFAGAKMGPELAFALLTMFFYSWNSKRNYRVKSNSVVLPISKMVCEHTKDNVLGKTKSESASMNSNEHFGFGAARDEICTANDTDNINAEEPGLVNIILNGVLRKIAFLKNVSKFCLPSLSYDIFLMPSLVEQILKASNTSSSSAISAKERLESVVHGHGFLMHEMPKDGDCLFSAVGFAISQLLTTDADDQDSAILHIKQLGFNPRQTLEDMSLRLRQLMVAEWRQNTSFFMEKLTGRVQQTFLEEMNRFLNPGEFCGEIGDLMVLAIANVLRMPIVLFTPIENFPFLTLYPTKEYETPSGNIIYLAYDNNGAGHYDAVIQQEVSGTSIPSSSKECTTHRQSQTSCSCGKNSKGEDKHCENRIRYTTRCPCFKSGRGCHAKCKCKNCENQFGSRCAISTYEQGRKRKRKSQLMGGERLDGKEYMENVGEETKTGRWTEEETILLFEIISHIGNENLHQVCNTFNNCVPAAKEAGIHCGIKDNAQVLHKVAHFNKRKRLSLLQLEEQIFSYINEIS